MSTATQPARTRPVAMCGVVAFVASCASPPEFRSTTVPTDTYDSAGPYVVTTVLRPGAMDLIEILYCTDPASLMPPAGGTPPVFHSIPMALIDERAPDATYRGELPGQPPDTQVAFYLRARQDDTVVTDPAAAELAPGKKLPAGQALPRYSFKVLRSNGPCSLDTDCGPGQLCDQTKKCRGAPVTCASDGECPSGMACDDSRCVVLARSCAAAADCRIGEVCDRTSRTCGPPIPCAGEADCRAGTVCDADAGLCRTSCVGDGECDPSESCKTQRCLPKAP